jgi:arsenate reductase-like glutaredoxin family protein
MTCTRAQEFLAQEQVEVAELVDAKKGRLGPEEALALARKASELFVSKGRSVVHVEMKSKPPDEELLKLLLGPSGNLRAPTIRKGSTLLIGFDPEAYALVLQGIAPGSAGEKPAATAAKPAAKAAAKAAKPTAKAAKPAAKAAKPAAKKSAAKTSR